MNPNHRAAFIIADELAEHYAGRRPFGEPHAMLAKRADALNQVLETVLRELSRAGLVASFGSTPNEDGGRTWHATCHVDSFRLSTATLRFVHNEGSLACKAYPLDATSPATVVPAEVYWIHHPDAGWVGPRIARQTVNRDEWLRESAEAAVTRAILKALDAVAPDDP